MIFQKIGKDKHKYKAFLTFLKVKKDSTPKGLCFRIKLIRYSFYIAGAHILSMHTPCPPERVFPNSMRKHT